MNEDLLKKAQSDSVPQKALRTYEKDVADVLAHKNISATQIALAESRRASGQNSLGVTSENTDQTYSEGTPMWKKSLVAILSLVLVGGGLFGMYYLYTLSPLGQKGTVVTTSTAPQGIVPADSYSTINTNNLTIRQILQALSVDVQKSRGAPSIHEIIPITTASTGDKKRLTTGEMIALSDLELPGTLSRSLGDAWMMGVYTTNSGDRDVFIVLSITYFQNAFAGMLEWEKVIADDLKQYLSYTTPSTPPVTTAPVSTPASANPLQYLESILPSSQPAPNMATTSDQKPRGHGSLSEPGETGSIKTSENSLANKTGDTGTATSTTTSTSTQTATEPVATAQIKGTFVDRIIQNKDVREYILPDGSTAFLYSFVDNTKLVITTKESTLSEILKRLEEKDLMR